MQTGQHKLTSKNECSKSLILADEKLILDQAFSNGCKLASFFETLLQLGFSGQVERQTLLRWEMESPVAEGQLDNAGSDGVSRGCSVEL